MADRPAIQDLQTGLAECQQMADPQGVANVRGALFGVVDLAGTMSGQGSRLKKAFALKMASSALPLFLRQTLS